MKKVRTGLIMVLVLLYCITARGYEIGKYDFYHDGIYYQIIGEEETEMWVAVERGEEEYTNSLWILPEFTYNGKACYVKWIGENAFSDCRDLTAVFIPYSVDYIPYNAFYGCSNLTTISVVEGNPCYDSRNDCNAIISKSENNVLIVGCSTTIIPEDVIAIGEAAFIGCGSPKSITIPDNVTEIRGGAFSNCWELENVIISENSKLTSIGFSAFYGCSSLTSITIPKGVTSISEAAFEGCWRLQDVYCYAENIPTNEYENGPFWSEEIKNTTLHVPLSAIESYRTTAPWSSFGKIVAIGVPVTDIVLNQTTATMVEGDTLELIANVMPEVADNSIVWSSSNESVAVVDNQGRVVAIAPGTVTITATAADDSGVSSSCEIVVKKDIVGRCATPTLIYSSGKVKVTCDTEGAVVKTKLDIENDMAYEGLEFDLIPTYTLTAYATKDQYEDSEAATLTLCWIPCDGQHMTTEVTSIPSKPVLIQSQGGTITLNGISDDTEVAAYDLVGNQLDATTATGGAATLTTNLAKGDIIIVKIGNNSIKIAIK